MAPIETDELIGSVGTDYRSDRTPWCGRSRKDFQPILSPSMGSVSSRYRVGFRVSNHCTPSHRLFDTLSLLTDSISAGDYNELLSHLIEYDILDLDIADAPLEDVFMRFYGDVNPDSEGDPNGEAESVGTPGRLHAVTDDTADRIAATLPE